MTKIILIILMTISIPAYSAEVPTRIVSTGGALTEIIYQLGEGAKIVGTDTTSYYPKAADALPKVGYQRALSAEGILSLNPDLIIHTEEAGPITVFEQLNSTNVNLLLLKSGRSMGDVIYNIKRIATVLDKEKEGKQLINKIKTQLTLLKSIITKKANKPRILFVHRHGGGTPAAAGKNTAADGMISLSGGINVVTEFDGYKPLTPEAAIALAPDIIVVAAPKADQIKDKNALVTHPALAQTPAGRNGHIIAMDALFILGFGPRTAEAAATLHKAYQAL